MSRECRSARFPSSQEDLLIQSVDHFIKSGRSTHPVRKIISSRREVHSDVHARPPFQSAVCSSIPADPVTDLPA